MEFSLITVAQHRPDFLYNFLKGVGRNSWKPAEILIINLCGCALMLGDFPDLNIRVFDLDKDSEDKLPLAKARNLGASEAENEHLVFLDDDCIPSEHFFRDLLREGKKVNGLVMGNPRYMLGPIEGSDFDEEYLRSNSVLHHYRPLVKELSICNNPELFWCLCFYLKKTLFFEIGGFDEAYKGYARDDADMALTLTRLGYNFYLSEACVYHQQHEVYSPPLKDFEPLISNAIYFYKKWGYWPMSKWLQQFVNLGLIKWSECSKCIKILASPSSQLIEMAQRKRAPFV